MNKRDNLISNLGNTMAESLGLRPGETTPGEAPAAAASPMDGRTRSRDAGEMEIEKIIPDPDQPRKEFDENAIERLAESIRDKGQLQPIRVRWSPEHAKWVIIAGERRYRAIKQAGLPTAKCIFVEGDLSEDDIFEEQIIENCLREDLKPIEQARAFQALKDRKGITAKQVAGELSLAPTTVTRALSLLKLPDDVQTMVDAGELSPRATREVLKLKDTDQQRSLAKQIVTDGLTSEQAATAAERKAKRRKAKRTKKNAHSFTTQNGAKVHVTFRKKVDDAEVLVALEQALAHVRSRMTEELEEAA